MLANQQMLSGHTYPVARRWLQHSQLHLLLTCNDGADCAAAIAAQDLDTNNFGLFGHPYSPPCCHRGNMCAMPIAVGGVPVIIPIRKIPAAATDAFRKSFTASWYDPSFQHISCFKLFLHATASTPLIAKAMPWLVWWCSLPSCYHCHHAVIAIMLSHDVMGVW